MHLFFSYRLHKLVQLPQLLIWIELDEIKERVLA